MVAAITPAFVPAEGDRRLDIGVVLPSAMAGLLVLAIVSAIASGGGRELISREQGVAFPVSPATDHLGALVLAPLNIAWLIQAWVLLGSAAFVVGARVELGALQVVMVLWLALATAAGQLVAWTFEMVRRRRHGVAVVRVVLAALAATALAVQLGGRTTEVLDRVPTVWLLTGGLGGFDGRWLLTVGVQLAVLLVVVVVGVVPVTLASRLMPHDELRAETDVHTPRRMPWSDLSALLRLDRASVWRSVPMRRGLGVLAVGPGLVALLGNLPWAAITILPGLVASGGALLFGVNAWCLDARGTLWRENLPAGPGTVFWARVIVLAEFLGLASLATIAHRRAAGRRAVGERGDRAGLHLPGRDRAGRRRLDAVVGTAALPRRPAQRPGDAGAADDDGGVLLPAGGLHDVHRAGVLRPRAGAEPRALGVLRDPLPHLVLGAPRPRRPALERPGHPGAGRGDRRGLSETAQSCASAQDTCARASRSRAGSS